MADGSFSRPRTFDEYLRSYRDDHQHPVNRLCHMIGVPMIVASLPLIPTVPPVGVSLFGVGWGFQFVGHAFEGKKPSFARDLRYLAIGPVWAAIEWTELVTGKKFYELPETEPKPTF